MPSIVFACRHGRRGQTTQRTHNARTASYIHTLDCTHSDGGCLPRRRAKRRCPKTRKQHQYPRCRPFATCPPRQWSVAISVGRSISSPSGWQALIRTVFSSASGIMVLTYQQGPETHSQWRHNARALSLLFLLAPCNRTNFSALLAKWRCYPLFPRLGRQRRLAAITPNCPSVTSFSFFFRPSSRANK